jgi:pyridoxine 4-dehydrogenase
MGMLTGKYSTANLPPGMRNMQYADLLKRIPPLIQVMQEVAHNHGDKTVSQVALNWLICKGALPIPGAKNIRQAEQNAGGAGWRLTDEEVARLDEASDKVHQK